MARRKKGEGSIREYQPGKWVARMTVGGKQWAFYGDTEREAYKKMDEFRKKLIRGTNISKKMRYQELLEAWMETKKLRLKRQSYDRLHRVVSNHIIPIIGYYYLENIDSDLLQKDVINSRLESLSHSSIKKIYDALNASFRFAQQKGYLARNPMDFVEMPSVNILPRSAKQIEILTGDEIRAFVKVANMNYKNGAPVFPNGKMFLFMLNTGLRMGEVCALKWDAYDPVAQTITVDSNIAMIKNEAGKYVIIDQRTVKTKYSRRVLKLNSNAIECLPDKKLGKYIFSTKDGKPLRPRNVQNKLDKMLIRAGIPHKTTHVFRHTFASNLFARGYDVRIVSELLGHSNVNTTYNTYIHVINKFKADAMKSIENMY